MAQCRWPDGSCTNEATKVVYRMTTNEEKDASRRDPSINVSTRVEALETNVCDEHLEEAQKVYPLIANKEP